MKIPGSPQSKKTKEKKKTGGIKIYKAQPAKESEAAKAIRTSKLGKVKNNLTNRSLSGSSLSFGPSVSTPQ